MNGLLALAAGQGLSMLGVGEGAAGITVKEGPHVEPPGCRFLPQKLQVFRTCVCKGR